MKPELEANSIIPHLKIYNSKNSWIKHTNNFQQEELNINFIKFKKETKDYYTDTKFQSTSKFPPQECDDQTQRNQGHEETRKERAIATLPGECRTTA